MSRFGTRHISPMPPRWEMCRFFAFLAGRKMSMQLQQSFRRMIGWHSKRNHLPPLLGSVNSRQRLNLRRDESENRPWQAQAVKSGLNPNPFVIPELRSNIRDPCRDDDALRGCRVMSGFIDRQPPVSAPARASKRRPGLHLKRSRSKCRKKCEARADPQWEAGQTPATRVDLRKETATRRQGGETPKSRPL